MSVLAVQAERDGLVVVFYDTDKPSSHQDIVLITQTIERAARRITTEQGSNAWQLR